MPSTSPLRKGGLFSVALGDATVAAHCPVEAAVGAAVVYRMTCQPRSMGPRWGQGHGQQSFVKGVISCPGRWVELSSGCLLLVSLGKTAFLGSSP